MAFLYVVSAPCCWTVSSTFFTWSGRASAIPTNDNLDSSTFIISVPVEIRE